MSNEELMSILNDIIVKNLGHATAYGYAKSKGYEGTEEEFAELMADYAHVAQDAEASAAAAKVSEDNAKVSETNAKTSEDNAKESEDNAKVSETNADESETNAKQSELNADAYAKQSESWAVGTVDGSPVGQTHPAYHNNSKYYAEQAGTKATVATQAAETATQKASEASASETIATQKASEASTSATEAKTSEDNAKLSENTASNAAVSALNSRDSAAGSATTASNAATTATQKATEASQSATSASGSASTATQKATEASQSATSASGSASTATQKATEASNSASAAAQSAADAAESATHVADMALMQAIAPKYDSTAQYKVGNLLTYLGKQYYCIADTPAGTLPTNTTYFEEKSVADIIEMIKAGKITVGKATLADNFDSKMVLTDNSGYLFRTAGGSLEIGEQNRVKKIVGASVPIINAVPNGDFESTTGWSIATSSTTFSVADNIATITYSDVAQGYNHSLSRRIYAPVAGHKYLLIQTLKSDVSAEYGFDVYNVVVNAGTVPANVWTTQYAIISTNYVGYSGFFANPRVERPAGTCQIKNAMVIDLTATFGTTVANRLYALEQAQAGAGIAKAKEILVKDYYPYNVSAFTHTKTSGKVNTGFNQFNKNANQFTTFGSATIDGTKITVTGTYYCGLDIDLLPDRYYVRFDALSSGNTPRIRFEYDDGTLSDYRYSSGLITLTQHAKRIYLYCGNGQTATVVYDKVNINLHWDGERDGEFDEYDEWNYPVQDIELKGILSLDAQDNWVADGDEYLPDGTLSRNVYTVNTSDCTVASYGSTGYRWLLTVPQSAPEIYAVSDSITLKMFNSGGFIVSAKQFIPNNNTSGFYIGRSDSGNKSFIFTTGDSSIDTEEKARTYITNHPFLITYPVKTPTTDTADTYTEIQEVDNWGTEKWIDTRDVPLPVFSEAEYLPDLKAKTEVAPESPDEDGDYIMHRENGLNSYGSLSTWLSENGYNKLQDLLTAFGANGMVGGALRQTLCVKESLDFDTTDAVDLGNYLWNEYSAGFFTFIGIGNPVTPVNNDTPAKILCTGYKTNAWNNNDNGIALAAGGAGLFSIKDTNYTGNVDGFREHMKGVLLAYEKAST